MKLLKVLIVEDEDDCIDDLKVLLRQVFSGVLDVDSPHEIATARTVDQAVEILNANEFQVSFLDINIGTLCFDIFKRVHSNRSLGIVIYVTAQPVTAEIQKKLSLINPHSFLNKPINLPDLLTFRESFIEMWNNTPSNKEDKYFFFRNKEHTAVTITHEHIYYIEAHGSYVLIFYKKDNERGIIRRRKLLKEIPAFLGMPFYHRVSDKHVVNQNNVVKYHEMDGRTGEIEFKENSFARIPYYTDTLFKSLNGR